MARDIKGLLSKKGWTGEEVGRLMIADLVRCYTNLLMGEGDDGLLTDSEKSRLVDGLTETNDIRQYNNFRFAHDYIASVPMRYALHEQTAETYFWRLYHLIEQTRRVEGDAQDRLRSNPRIVTQSQYDELKKADFEDKMKWSYSVELLILHTFGYFLRQYQSGNKTPFDKYFAEAKKQPITNPRIKANYWEYGNNGYYKYPDGTTSRDKTQDDKDKEMEAFKYKKSFPTSRDNAFTAGSDMTVEQILTTIKERKRIEDNPPFRGGEWVDEPEAPEDATLYDVLECIDGFYSSEEQDSEEVFYEIEKDFPALYKAVWSHLTKIKALAFLNDIPKEEYVTNTERIPMKTLYDNNVLDFKPFIDTFDPTLNLSGYGGGIAILQESGSSYPKHRINDKGYYEEPEDLLFNNFRAEVLIDKYGNGIRTGIETIKHQYREMYALHTFLAIAGEFLGVKDLGILISPIDEEKIEALNGIFTDFDFWICGVRDGENSRTREQLIEEIKELLQPIKLCDLQPAEEAIKQARATINYDTFKGNAAALIGNLVRGGADE